MIHAKSVKSRMLTSVVFNVLRAIITFTTGIIIARGLSPAGYGDLMFLLGSFISIRTLLDMGSSNAFRTFISKANRGIRFYIYYIVWLTLQFFVMLLFAMLICPNELFERIWLGNSLNMVVLALLAVFMQQQVWQMVGQVGEASRQTGRVQLLNISVAIFYLLMIVCLWSWDVLSVEHVLMGLLGQYIVAVFFAYHYLKAEHIIHDEDVSLPLVLNEYWGYCRPLIVLSVVAFAYEFTDKWLLQKYGGAVQQGYFQIAFQFAAVALLATTSVLNVFWKEVAESWEKKNFSQAENLYRKMSRGLLMISAVIAGFLLPWAEQIVLILLGDAYEGAWMVLAIMFLYPIYQSLGQVGGAMLLAAGYTKRFMYVSVFSMLCSIPVTFYVLAPGNHEWINSLSLGATGLALKIVLLSLVTVNLQAWVVARCTGWLFDWKYQVVGITLMLGLGSASKIIVGLFMDVNALSVVALIVPLVLVGLLYLLFVGGVLWFLPWLVGMDRMEIRQLFGSIGVVKK